MKVDPRSYERNYMQLRKEAWKKFRTSTGFEPVTSRYRWSSGPLYTYIYIYIYISSDTILINLYWLIPWDACGTHGKNSVEFLFLHRIRKLQSFFKVSRNPFPAGNDVTIKTCPFFKYRVPGFEPETFGSKCVRAAFASPRYLASLRAKFDFLSLARFPRWRPRLQR